MAKVYSYLRFSDARQAAGASTERQQAYARDWAERNGLQLDDELSMRDEGLSAFHQAHVKKGALGVFLAAVEAGQVPAGSVLVVEGLDRLSRAEPLQALAQLTSIINAGISVATASDNRLYSREGLKANPMDLMHSLLVMIRANEESETKSRRVRDAIRRQCLGWQAGTYRGLIRYGQTPGWLRVVDGAWQEIPERAEAVRLAVDLALRGVGTGQIALRLHQAGMAIGAGVPTSGHLVRLLASPALVGDKHLQLGDERFELQGYYPAVITRQAWDDLRQALGSRARGRTSSEVPAVLTGLGITLCGYCGAPLKGQTMAHTRRADGAILDCNRRLQCSRNNQGQRCSVPGSCSVAPLERALMDYCSDLINLQALYRGDQTAAPRAAVAAASQALAELDRGLTRLTDLLLSDGQEPPAVVLRRLRDLEERRPALAAALQAAERDLATAARADITGAEERWQALRQGVLALDPDARLQARKLVGDTFERIVIHHRGFPIGSAPPGTVDMVLIARGGGRRLLRVDRNGGWVHQDEISPDADLDD